MKYESQIQLKNGKILDLRSGRESDGKAALEVFRQTHGETEYLLTYPEESILDERQEADFLRKREESPFEVEILAWVEGKLAGLAGIERMGNQCKIQHRAEFGISILEEYWGLGIGSALLSTCIDCAKKASFLQLELSVVAENTRALFMYKRAGFREYGRNPRGYRRKQGEFQELVHMRLEL